MFARRMFTGNMFSGRLTQATLRALDWLAARTFSRKTFPRTNAPAGAAKKTLTSIFAAGVTPSSRVTTARRIIVANWISSAGMATFCVLLK